MSTGRNDPCPCGSGAKYKRCCLEREVELERLVSDLEATVKRLGDETWGSDAEWCLSRLAEFYDGGIESFGLLGPDAAELFDAHLWFLIDGVLPDGQTPLWRMRRRVDGRAVELLARSELRAWRIESIATPKLVTVACPVSSDRARLELARELTAAATPAATIVARSVPLGPQRWAALGTPAVVEETVAPEFDALLASLDAPRGELWRVHGGVLARAAWAWPEEREVTVEGEVVESSLVSFALVDVPRAVAALEAWPGGVRVESREGGVYRWQLSWSTPPVSRRPRPEAGIRHRLCKEDAADPPHVAIAEIDLYYDDLWLFAPTPARLSQAERAVRELLDPFLGDLKWRDVEAPEITPRWKRIRFAEAYAPGGLAPRRAA